MNTQQNEHRLPFGKHAGKPVAEVPADYLLRALHECKLSIGLRLAIGVTRPARERWTFIIEPLPSGVPTVHRVRSALKMLLRVFRLRCVAVVEVPEEKTK
jgi:hypothetical protein